MSADRLAPPDSSAGRAVGRRAYTPQRHPAVRDRWTPEDVVRALEAWVRETGGVPRRRQWTGEHPERADDAQRKWMREHPRWPSASAVARHHGSWGNALEAAGLGARRPHARGAAVGDRVREARRLAAAGHPRREIARRLDVSVSSVGNYLEARDCPGCAEPVTNPHATRCGACAAEMPAVARTWTRDEAVQAIRDWTAAHGSPPTYRDWTPSRDAPGRWQAESPRWPSAAVVCDLFAGEAAPWNAALAAAGVAPALRRWSDEAVRDALAATWIRAGRAPAAGDLTGDRRAPSARTLRRRYGGVAAAWAALGPAPTDPDTVPGRR